MFALQEIMHDLATKDEVEIRGEKYRIKNLVSATDNESVLKIRVVLEQIAGIKNIDVDIDISAVVYKS